MVVLIPRFHLALADEGAGFSIERFPPAAGSLNLIALGFGAARLEPGALYLLHPALVLSDRRCGMKHGILIDTLPKRLGVADELDAPLLGALMRLRHSIR